MKKMKIFEPAMCGPTGLCGMGVDPELLRISTVLDICPVNTMRIRGLNDPTGKSDEELIEIIQRIERNIFSLKRRLKTL